MSGADRVPFSVLHRACRRLGAASDDAVRPGPNNALTDVAGLRVGHARVPGALSGTTVVLAPPEGAVAGVDVRGAAPGTRETDLLDPRNTVQRVHAVVLSGGSAFGLAAADGVMARLAAAGVGFAVPGAVVPIVPAAVLFDLGRGGPASDPVLRPTSATGAAAVDAAADGPVTQGVVGAGTGALIGGLKGGIGTASAVLDDGTTVAALAAVNAAGSAVDLATGVLAVPAGADAPVTVTHDGVTASTGAARSATSWSADLGHRRPHDPRLARGRGAPRRRGGGSPAFRITLDGVPTTAAQWTLSSVYVRRADQRRRPAGVPLPAARASRGSSYGARSGSARTARCSRPPARGQQHDPGARLRLRPRGPCSRLPRTDRGADLPRRVGLARRLPRHVAPAPATFDVEGEVARTDDGHGAGVFLVSERRSGVASRAGRNAGGAFVGVDLARDAFDFGPLRTDPPDYNRLDNPALPRPGPRPAGRPRPDLRLGRGLHRRLLRRCRRGRLRLHT